jgi:hypothetical protein
LEGSGLWLQGSLLLSAIVAAAEEAVEAGAKAEEVA